MASDGKHGQSGDNERIQGCYIKPVQTYEQWVCQKGKLCKTSWFEF